MINPIANTPHPKRLKFTPPLEPPAAAKIIFEKYKIYRAYKKVYYYTGINIRAQSVQNTIAAARRVMPLSQEEAELVDNLLKEKWVLKHKTPDLPLIQKEGNTLQSLAERRRKSVRIEHQHTPKKNGDDDNVFFSFGPINHDCPFFLNEADDEIVIPWEGVEKKSVWASGHFYAYDVQQKGNPLYLGNTKLTVNYTLTKKEMIIERAGDPIPTVIAWEKKDEVCRGEEIPLFLAHKFVEVLRAVSPDFRAHILANRFNPPLIANALSVIFHSGCFEAHIPVSLPLGNAAINHKAPENEELINDLKLALEDQDHDEIKRLAALGADINNLKWQPLAFVFKKDISLAKLLLDLGANPALGDKSPLRMAFGYPEHLKLFLEYGYQNQFDPAIRHSPVLTNEDFKHAISNYYNEELFVYLAAQRAWDIEVFNHGLTLAENCRIAELFLKLGADINCISNGMTPLIAAIKDNDVTLVQFLIGKGADVNKNSPLKYTENEEIIRCLVDNGAKEEETPITCQRDYCCVQSVDPDGDAVVLLKPHVGLDGVERLHFVPEKGDPVFRFEESWQNALYTVEVSQSQIPYTPRPEWVKIKAIKPAPNGKFFYRNHPVAPLAAYLLMQEPEKAVQAIKNEIEGYDRLRQAIKDNDLFAIRCLSRQGIELNARNRNLDPPLYYAFDCGRLEAARELIACGADMRIMKIHTAFTMVTKESLLDKAAYALNMEMIRLLALAKSKELEDRQSLNSALVNACHQTESAPVVRYLLEKGADNYDEALELAAQRGSGESVMLLMAKASDEAKKKALDGALNQMRNTSGYKQTLLLLAPAGDLETQRFLFKKSLEVFVDFEYARRLGLVPGLMDEIPNSTYEFDEREAAVIAQMIHSPSNPYTGAFLVDAVSWGKKRLAELALKSGDFDPRTLHHDPKMWLCFHGGELPLQTALRKSDREMVELLLRYGVSVHSEDWEGKTPHSLVRSPDLMRLLDAYATPPTAPPPLGAEWTGKLLKTAYKNGQAFFQCVATLFPRLKPHLLPHKERLIERMKKVKAENEFQNFIWLALLLQPVGESDQILAAAGVDDNRRALARALLAGQEDLALARKNKLAIEEFRSLLHIFKNHSAL